MRHLAAGEVELVLAEGQLVQISALHFVAHIEVRIALVGGDVLPVLRHHAGETANGIRVVDGMRILVVRADGDSASYICLFMRTVPALNRENAPYSS